MMAVVFLETIETIGNRVFNDCTFFTDECIINLNGEIRHDILKH